MAALLAGASVLAITIWSALAVRRAVGEARAFRAAPSRAEGHRLLAQSGLQGVVARLILFKSGGRLYREDLRWLVYHTPSPLADSWINRRLLDHDVAQMSDAERAVYLPSYPLTPTQRVLDALHPLLGVSAPEDLSEHDFVSDDECGTFRVLARSAAGRAAIDGWARETLIAQDDPTAFDGAFRCLLVARRASVVTTTEKYWAAPEFDRPWRMYQLAQEIGPGDPLIDQFLSLWTRLLESNPGSLDEIAPAIGVIWRAPRYTETAGALIRAHLADWLDRIAERSRDGRADDTDEPQESGEEVDDSSGDDRTEATIDDLFGVVDAEEYPRWTVARVRPHSVSDDSPTANLPSASEPVVSAATKLIELAQERQLDAVSIAVVTALARTNILSAEAVAAPVMNGPDSRVAKDMIATLLRAGSASAAEHIDQLFGGTEPWTVDLPLHSYVYASEAAARYAQLARHGYVQTGKLWPPAHFERSVRGDVTEWTDFIQQYPWFPGADDAYYRLAFTHLYLGEPARALDVVDEYFFAGGREKSDQDSDRYLSHLLAFIAAHYPELSHPRLGLEHIRRVRQTPGYAFLVSPQLPNRAALRASVLWFLDDPSRCALIAVEPSDLTLLKAAMDVDPHLTQCERLAAIADLPEAEEGGRVVNRLAAIGTDDPDILAAFGVDDRDWVRPNPRGARYLDGPPPPSAQQVATLVAGCTRDRVAALTSSLRLSR